jgi:hypothetical protein
MEQRSDRSRLAAICVSPAIGEPPFFEADQNGGVTHPKVKRWERQQWNLPSARANAKDQLEL